MPIFIGTLIEGEPPPPPSVNSEPVIALRGNQSNIGCWSLGYQPNETKTVTLVCDFSQNGAVSLNINELIDQRKIDAVRSLYCYNDTEYPINISNEPISQLANFSAMTFGFMPILALNNQNIILTADPAIGTIKVVLTNVVMPHYQGSI